MRVFATGCTTAPTNVILWKNYDLRSSMTVSSYQSEQNVTAKDNFYAYVNRVQFAGNGADVYPQLFQASLTGSTANAAAGANQTRVNLTKDDPGNLVSLLAIALPQNQKPKQDKNRG